MSARLRSAMLSTITALLVVPVRALCAEESCPVNAIGRLYSYGTAFANATSSPEYACADDVASFIASILTRAGYLATDVDLTIEVAVDDDHSTGVDITQIITQTEDAGVVFFGAQGTHPREDPEHSGGFPILELFLTPQAAQQRKNALIAPGGDLEGATDTWYVELGPSGGASVWGIAVGPLGIAHMDDMGYGSFLASLHCYGDRLGPVWTSPMTKILATGQSPVVGGCDDMSLIWAALGCQSGSPNLPYAGAATQGALYHVLQGNALATIRCSWQCETQETFYRNVVAFLDSLGGYVTVGFQTDGETASITHTVRGYSSLSAYPASPDTLVTIQAAGGHDAIQAYWSSVPGSHAFYDVTEGDSLGRETWSEPVPVTSQPMNWDSIKALSWQKPFIESTTADLYEYVDDEWVLWSAQKRLTERTPAGKAADAPCYFCADYILFTHYSDSSDAFVRPVRDSLLAQGLDVRVFASTVSTGLINARPVLAQVTSDNATWNGGPSGATRPYPVDPGPTLLVVGDANPEIVAPMTFQNPDPESFYTWLYTYVLVADLDNDSIPDCPVELLPANSVVEVQSSVVAAADFNRGRFVDPEERVLPVAGDRRRGTTASWLKDFIASTGTLYGVHGMAPASPVVESDYAVGDYAAIRAATTTLVNEGIQEGFLYGRSTYERDWPAHCIGTSAQPVGTWTRKQRIVFLAPGCYLGRVWIADEVNSGLPPIVESLMRPFHNPFFLLPGHHFRARSLGREVVSWAGGVMGGASG